MEEINLGKIPFDVHFHPSDNLVATALINGDLHLYRFGPDMVLVRDSCRAVRFIDCGRVLLTASSDCSILATDVETGSTITRIHNAHKAAVNRLINLTESTVASGDDDGFIKNGREIVCGSQSRLIMYSWEGFKDISLMKIELLLGSENGIINLVGISPNKISPNFVRKIVEHPRYPVECLAFSHNRKFLGSIARDEMLKLWDLDSILPDTRNTQRQRCAPMGFG
ncbi:hypothetical protein ACSQ67_009779 [Phaseolus vulgaris]